jgi:hypothetical protein
MTDDQPSGDNLLAKLRGGYDLTEGIPPAEHDHSSVRRVEHAGHRLEVHTYYRIFIDGQEFPDPIHVGDDGRVHYHGIPQYSAASAVDLVKMIAERLEEGEPPPLIGEPQHGQDHHNHDHEHDGGGH